MPSPAYRLVKIAGPTTDACAIIDAAGTRVQICSDFGAGTQALAAWNQPSVTPDAGFADPEDTDHPTFKESPDVEA